MSGSRAGFAPSVDFLVAGAQKSGTSALRSFLRQHPEIGLTKPGIEEAHYFDRDTSVADDPDYSGYHSLFLPGDLEKVTGDVTPIYLFRPEALQRARAYNPDLKIIVLLRHPVERAYSQWAMEFQRGSETADFVQALLQEPYYAIHRPRHRVHSYMQRGFYGEQIRRLFTLFPKENCLVLLNEDLRDAHAATLRKVYRFLGVREIPAPTPKRVHSRTYPRMPDGLCRLLGQIFEQDIRDLEALIDRDLSAWKAGP